MPLIITCEHGGADIPAEWGPLFADASDSLNSHRGYDLGAAAVAGSLAERLQAPCHMATVSRLLVDLNRSPGHRQLYSEWTRGLGMAERQRIYSEYYQPYRAAVEQALASALHNHQKVLHLSIHSFTPELNGEVRSAELGLLYDPARQSEKDWSIGLQRRLQQHLPELRVRRNYPYTGVQDGFIPWLRRRFSGQPYLGIELEFNQRLLMNERARSDDLTRAIGDWLQHSC